MKKFKKYLEKWIAGEKISGFDISLYDIHTCIDIYNAIARKEKPEFINGKAKAILDKCGIKTSVCGIGWKVI